MTKNKPTKQVKQKPLLQKPPKEAGGHWHGYKEFNLGAYSKLRISGAITGCGLGQLHGVIYLDNEAFINEFKKAVADFKRDGVGAFICTLGQSHYHREQSLLDLGFERISEYHNYRHGQAYMQRLYILKV